MNINPDSLYSWSSLESLLRQFQELKRLLLFIRFNLLNRLLCLVNSGFDLVLYDYKTIIYDYSIEDVLPKEMISDVGTIVVVFLKDKNV